LPCKENYTKVAADVVNYDQMASSYKCLLSGH